MDTQNGFGKDGKIGLGVLVLMVAAFVAGESQSDWRAGTIDVAERPIGLDTQLLIDLGPAGATVTMEDDMIESTILERNLLDGTIEGAIRELSVVPIDLDERLDLNWSSDDDLIEEHKLAGF